MEPVEITPLVSRFPVLRGATPIAIAHRGGAWEEPENTERAFRHAVSLGYSFLETDVRATSDGVPVVFHDGSLDRTTDGHGLIREQTWEQVSTAKIHGREPILRLDSLFQLFPMTRFNIDIKEQSAILPFLNTIRRCGAWSRVCVGSFSQTRLTKVRRLAGPRLATSLSPREVIGLYLDSQGLPNRFKPPQAACVQIPVSMGRLRFAQPQFIDAAHRLGWQVHVWTIDKEATMAELMELGVDGIMTDRPRVLRDVLQTAGWWPDSTH